MNQGVEAALRKRRRGKSNKARLNDSEKLILRAKEYLPIIVISGVLRERLEQNGISGVNFLLPEDREVAM